MMFLLLTGMISLSPVKVNRMEAGRQAAFQSSNIGGADTHMKSFPVGFPAWAPENTVCTRGMLGVWNYCRSVNIQSPA